MVTKRDVKRLLARPNKVRGGQEHYDEYRAECDAVRQALIALGSGAVEPLTAVLGGNPIPGEVRIIAEALGTIGEESAVGALRDQLARDDLPPEIKRTVSRTLAQLGEQDQIQCLIDYVKAGDRLAVQDLFKLGEAVVPYLADCLQDPQTNETTRWDVINRIGIYKLAAPDLLPVFLAMEPSDMNVASAGALARTLKAYFGQGTDDRIVEKIETLTDVEHPRARGELLDALTWELIQGQELPEQVLPIVKRLLPDKTIYPRSMQVFNLLVDRGQCPLSVETLPTVQAIAEYYFDANAANPTASQHNDMARLATSLAQLDHPIVIAILERLTIESRGENTRVVAQTALDKLNRTRE